MSRPRHKTRQQALRMPGVRFVQRPATAHTPGFDLGYVRSGPQSTTPLVVIPGGPGLGSVLPYGTLRRRAVKSGMDIMMVEHRGVGLSRTDSSGTDLPHTAMTIPDVVDDIRAVLDAEKIDRAIIYGSSYGSYVAQAFGAWHGDRVAGMVLDSTIASAHDHHVVRSHARQLLWEGGTPRTAGAARQLRGLVDSGLAGIDEASEVARIVYEFAGLETLERLLRARARGKARRSWQWLAGLGARETTQVMDFIMEFDLVDRIAFQELNYAPEPDGGPFDPATNFRELAADFEPFSSEPLDLSAHHPGFSWPVAILSGDRDLRTPRPIAEKVAQSIPDCALIPVADTGHSVLDTHGLAALATVKAVREHTHHALATDPSPLDKLSRTGTSRHIATILRAWLRFERLIPLRRPARPEPHAGTRE